MTLGILGGGQLGRMTALAALPLGVRVRFLVNEPADCVADFADVTVADWTDPDVLRAFAAGCDAVTVESEWAPADLLAEASPETPVYPNPDALQLIRNKGHQRLGIAELGLPQPDCGVAARREEMDGLAAELGFPLVAKRLEGSYDGYGNAVVHGPGDLDAAWAAVGSDEGVLLEAFVDFEAEVTALVCIGRTSDGQPTNGIVYPILRTEQRDGRCHAVTVPSGFSPDIEVEAERIAGACAVGFGIVGMLAVEMFVTKDGAVLVNELAPRPHNSGHLTIEACPASQFENHARAVLGLPLGPAALVAPTAAMVNILGTTAGPVDPLVLAKSGALAPDGGPPVHVHLYGKAASRPRRKMGHVTALADTPEAARAAAEAVAARLVF